MCILLVILTFMYHEARFRQCKNHRLLDINISYFVTKLPKLGLGRPVVKVYRLDTHSWTHTVGHTHTHTHTHTQDKTPLNQRSARRCGRYLQNTRQTKQTNIHALSGIRNRAPGNQAAEDLRFRPHCHRDRLEILIIICETVIKI